MKTDVKNRISTFYVLQAESITGRTVDKPESNSLPVGIFEASLEGPLALAGVKIDHTDAEEQRDKNQTESQSFS
jgi:hypothetical protein